MTTDLTATLEVVLTRLDAIDKRLDKVLDDHEQRLRKVEHWIYAVPPTLLLAMASVVAAVVSA